MFRKKADDNAVSLAQSAMCCARVKDLLERSVRELQQYQASHDFPEIISSLGHAGDVCAALEAVFLHNFRAPFSAKMSSTFARLGRRQSVENLPETSFLPYVTQYTPRDFMEQLSGLTELNTVVGQCRGWVRLGLNHNLMLSYIEAMLADTTSLSSWYSEGAFLLDEACATLLCSLVRGLSTCDFNLTCNCTSLNVWTRQVLQMVGVYQPTATAAASSSSPSESPGAGDGNAVRSKSVSQASHRISVDKTPSARKADTLPRSESCAGDLTRPGKSPGPSPLQGTRAGPVSRGEQAGSASSAQSITNRSPDTDPATSGEQSAASPSPRSSGPGSFSIASASLSSFARKSSVTSTAMSQETNSAAPVMTDASVQRLRDDLLPDKNARAEPVAAAAAAGTPGKAQQATATSASTTSAQPVAAAREQGPQAPTAPADDGKNGVKKSRSLHKKKEKDRSKAKRRKAKKATLVLYSDRNAGVGKHHVPYDNNMDDHMGLILKIANEHGLESQTYQCHACTRPIGVLFGEAKVCGYDGRYYCTECHLDEEEVIPARLVHNWDFHKYKVCKANIEVLHSMEEQPVIDLASTNPSLYTHVSELQDVKFLRSQLRALYSYVSTCKEPKILDEFQKRLPRDHLVQCNEHIYSVQDLVQVQSGVLVQSLKKLFVFASKHVHECQVCRMKGFICEICKDEEVIFAFDVATCTQCARCLAVFHRVCKEPLPCPKCQRLALRQQRMMSQDNEDSDG